MRNSVFSPFFLTHLINYLNRFRSVKTFIMSEEKKDSKKCVGKNKVMFLYGFTQLGSSILSAVALAVIAFGFCSLKKESKFFNNCVTEVIESGSSNAEAVRYCNGGK